MTMTSALGSTALLLVSIVLGAAGCGGNGDTGAPTTVDAAFDSSTADAAFDSSTTDAPTEEVAKPDGSTGSAVPTNAEALLPWLQARSYAAFPKESKVHASTGPHGGSVRTYITSSLDASLAAKAAEHPSGAAMVKELYGGGEVTGWAVAVKTAATRGETTGTGTRSSARPPRRSRWPTARGFRAARFAIPEGRTSCCHPTRFSELVKQNYDAAFRARHRG